MVVVNLANLTLFKNRNNMIKKTIALGFLLGGLIGCGNSLNDEQSKTVSDYNHEVDAFFEFLENDKFANLRGSHILFKKKYVNEDYLFQTASFINHTQRESIIEISKTAHSLTDHQIRINAKSNSLNNILEPGLQDCNNGFKCVSVTIENVFREPIEQVFFDTNLFQISNSQLAASIYYDASYALPKKLNPASSIKILLPVMQSKEWDWDVSTIIDVRIDINDKQSAYNRTYRKVDHIIYEKTWKLTNSNARVFTIPFEALQSLESETNTFNAGVMNIINNMSALAMAANKIVQDPEAKRVVLSESGGVDKQCEKYKFIDRLLTSSKYYGVDGGAVDTGQLLQLVKDGRQRRCFQ